MKEHKIGRWARFGLAAVAAGAVALTAFAMPANAAVSTGNIDTTAPRSLTIHKYEQPAEGDLGPNDGQEITPAPDGNPLVGVTFSVQRVTDIDLLTTAGWTAAQALTVAEAQTGPLGTDIGGATGPGGVLAIDDLDIGLYLVQETDPGANNIVAAAQPFLVAVPQPMGDGQWNYNVHVYPKNALQDAPVKTVDDSNAFTLGDVVSWGIAIDVPRLSQGSTYTEYSIVDALEPELGFESISLAFSDGAVTTLVEGTHYSAATPDAGENGTVTIEFLPAGLALLNGASGNAEIIGTLETTVLSIGNGTITNQFEVVVNGKGTSSNIPETHWGALEVVKHAAGNTTTTLQGATFNLYTNAGSSAEPVEGTLIAADLTTDANGEIHVDGLKEGNYVLKETAAPAGYQLNSQLIPVTIERGTVASPNIYLVPNAQELPFELPLTGGTGTIAFTVIGLALIAFASGAYLVARKRRAAGADTEL